MSRPLAAVALAGVVLSGPPVLSIPPIEKPLMFDTPEADRVLEGLQVFPPDNPWHEDIRTRPRHPHSDAMVRGIGADQALGYNLDMNFVIVPPRPAARAGADHGVSGRIRPGALPDPG